jgi:hypothetical protein
MRRDFPLREQLAAALRDMMVPDGNGGFERAIPWEHARNMTSCQILALFQRDHYPIRHEMGGPNVHWNCQWLFKGDHNKKTAKRDQPEIAKSKRIRKKEAEFRAAISMDVIERHGAVYMERPKPKAKIKSRGFQKGQRKLEGRSSWPKKAPK